MCAFVSNQTWVDKRTLAAHCEAWPNTERSKFSSECQSWNSEHSGKKTLLLCVNRGLPRVKAKWPTLKQVFYQGNAFFCLTPHYTRQSCRPPLSTHYPGKASFSNNKKILCVFFINDSFSEEDSVFLRPPCIDSTNIDSFEHSPQSTRQG